MQNPFSSITTAGLLLPLDLLTRVGTMDRALPGMTPADYHVPGSIRLNEAATAAYSRALAYWKSFRKKFDALPASDTGTTLTRDEWLLPLFDCLGYGRLQNKRAITIDSKDYPISHGWEDHVPIHLLSARLPLDKRTQNVSGAATRSPYSLVQELLNRSAKHRWGFVSNGLKLYVLRDNASLTRSANVEFDLESMMDGEYHADFTVLFLVCHQSRLEIHPASIVDNKSSNKKAAKPAKPKKSASKVAEKLGKYELDLDDDSGDESELDVYEEAVEIEEPTRLGPENCWLEAWTKLAGEQGTRAKERLRDGVQLAIQTFGAGFYTCTSNAVLHERLRSGELSTQDYYRQLLRLVYRLLMLMVAEDKRTESGQNLLHPLDTPGHIRNRYNQFYSVGRIRKLANERRGTPHRDLYESLKTTFLKLHDGYAPLGIPGIGSFLFSDTATPDLDTAQITNEALLDAFRHLCFTDDATGRGGSIRRAVDFGNLGSEELGSIYESLLELHPEIDSQDGPFVLRSAAGNERKTSGSYYTPTSLINCLLDSALDPVVNQAIDIPDREEAKRRLLNLKVCDPACGSGHFLIAAANRMALHFARLETQDTEPTTLQIQHAKRQIIGRCIYGVDLNPMAVELCKVSLWMETIEPGKPLSFLDHHIRAGNSLIGTTPKNLKDGIPNDAFKLLENDNTDTCTELKNRNTKERSGAKQNAMQQELWTRNDGPKLGNMASVFARLSAADENSVEDVRQKELEFANALRGDKYRFSCLLADLWCASFFWRKDESEIGKLCPTQYYLKQVEQNPFSIPKVMHEEIKRLAEQYSMFHWHLAFPDVFTALDDNEAAANDVTGWSQGFDVVLGNPPWEVLEDEEKKFFSAVRPDIASAATTRRKRLIADLAEQDRGLYSSWQTFTEERSRFKAFHRHSGRYPLSSYKKLNLYASFIELNLTLIKDSGYCGMVVQSGLATDESRKFLFQHIFKLNRLRSLFDFENTEELFVGVHPQQKFSLVTISGKTFEAPALLSFYNTRISHLDDADKTFSMTGADMARMSPNTGACPTFRSRRDGEIVRRMFLNAPVYHNDQYEAQWDFHFQQMLNSSSDEHSFDRVTTTELNGSTVEAINRRKSANQVPIYEGKFIGHFNHRFSTFHRVSQDSVERGAERESEIEELANPSVSVIPRWWVSTEDVRNRVQNHQPNRNWLFGFCDIANPQNARTATAGIFPLFGSTDTVWLLLGEIPCEQVAYVCAMINSYAFDFVARRRIGSRHLKKFVFKQLPFVPPTTADLEAPWQPTCLVKEFISHRFHELTFTSWDMQEFSIDLGFDGPPFRWNENRRFQIRCELDAAYLQLYLGSKNAWGFANGRDKNGGVTETLVEMFPTPRDAVGYIMDTFPIVRRKDEAKYGEYRTKRVILEIFDQMSEVIEANENIHAANPGKSEAELRPLLRSYQSPLTPPPGPPTDANGNFIPYADWTDEIHQQYAGVIHPPKRSLVGLPKLELIRDLLLVLEAWNTPASISAIEPALILIRDDRARAILSGDRRSTQLNPVKREPVRIEGLQTVYLTLEANQTISKVGESGYRLAKPEVTAQFPDSIKVKASQAVAIVKSFAEPAEASTAVASECSFDFELAGESNG